MSDVLNKTTLQYRRSVNTPDFPVADWIINPDLSEVAGVPQRHWKLDGEAVVEMTAQEKSAVDTRTNGTLIKSAREKMKTVVGITDEEFEALF